MFLVNAMLRPPPAYGRFLYRLPEGARPLDAGWKISGWRSFAVGRRP